MAKPTKKTIEGEDFLVTITPMSETEKNTRWTVTFHNLDPNSKDQDETLHATKAKNEDEAFAEVEARFKAKLSEKRGRIGKAKHGDMD